jgi:hypothetical protein
MVITYAISYNVNDGCGNDAQMVSRTVIVNEAVLPVEIADFTGRFNGKTIDLDWNTASEESNDFFSVERSTDVELFTAIGRVTGLNTATHYSFRDDNPVMGLNYYRLRQNDFDGNFAYSDVIQLTASGTGLMGADVYPNPAKGSFNLELKGEWDETVTVSLLDQNGRVLNSWSRSSSVLIQLPLPQLTSGIYQVRTEDEEHAITTKLVVTQ